MEPIKIKLTDEECRKVEKEFFEYQAIKDILTFINSQDSINIGVLKEYMAEAEERFTELERAKREVSKASCPPELEGKDYDYEFNFNNQEIIFYEVK